MNLQDGKVHLEPGERVIVVEDHGFMAGIFAIIVYRHHRFNIPQGSLYVIVRRINWKHVK